MNLKCDKSAFKAQSKDPPDLTDKKVRFEIRNDGETHNLDSKLWIPGIGVPSLSNNTHSSSLNLVSWKIQTFAQKKFQFVRQFEIILIQEAGWPLDKDQWIYQNKYQTFVKKRIGNPLTTLVIKRLICERREDLETANSLVVQVEHPLDFFNQERVQVHYGEIQLCSLYYWI